MLSFGNVLVNYFDVLTRAAHYQEIVQYGITLMT